MRAPIPRLNFQHLLYFWSVVRNGSLTKACAELHLSAPTVSAQLRTFEERLGSRLLMKSGRTLVPTEAGRLVSGIDDTVPKKIAQRLLREFARAGRVFE